MTPPITGFNVNMATTCAAPAAANNFSILVTDNAVYNISVTARNIVGDSEPALAATKSIGNFSLLKVLESIFNRS